MTDLNADTRQPPANPPPELSRGARRARADRAAATAAAEKRWPLSRIIGVALLILLLFSVAAMVAGGLALLGLHDNRERVVGTIDPARLQVQRLDTALVDQETGVRGYALSGQKDFLAPYNEGMTEERNAIKALQAVIGQLPPSAAADLKSVTAQARFWRTHYAQPTIDRVSQAGKPVVSPDILNGKADFDALRARVDTLQAHISGARTQAVAALNDSATVLDGVFIAVAARPRGHRGAARARPAGDSDQAAAPARRRGPPGGRRRLRARGHAERPAGSDQPGRGREQHARAHLAGARRDAGREHRPAGAHPGAGALELRARAVRLHRLARPAGAAAQGGELHPAAAAPLRRASWTPAPTSTSSSPSTAPSGCRR